MTNEASYKGIILVGGPSTGTRFRPLSMDFPKPLFPVAGNPIIYHHIAALAKIQGMKEIFLIGFYEQSVFDSFLREVQLEFPFVVIRYLREYQSMGTAGGINHFRDEIQRDSPAAFFVLNGDIASSFPLKEMLTSHKKNKGTATLLSVRMDKKKLHRYGCVVVEEGTAQVKHFVEKPESFVSDLISCGIYLFDLEIFNDMSEATKRRQAYEDDHCIDISQFEHKVSLAASNAAMNRSANRVQIEDDLLPLLINKMTVFAHVMSIDDFWMPIKTGSSTITANRMYLQYFLQANPKRLTLPFLSPTSGTASSPRSVIVSSPVSERVIPEIIQPSFIHPTAVIHPSSKIGPNAFVGAGVLIGRGCRVRDAIILDKVEIKNESCILNAVVGWESKIGAWTRIEGSLENVDESKDAATAKGLKIPSAAILGKGVTVGDELIIRDCIVLPHKELKKSFQREILM